MIDRLGPITQQEWDQELGRKSRYTSGGNTGVRPDMVNGGAVVQALLGRLYLYIVRAWRVGLYLTSSGMRSSWPSKQATSYDRWSA